VAVAATSGFFVPEGKFIRSVAPAAMRLGMADDHDLALHSDNLPRPTSRSFETWRERTDTRSKLEIQEHFRRRTSMTRRSRLHVCDLICKMRMN
jgi:hypothetical protein